jgi:hypothetical protein
VRCDRPAAKPGLLPPRATAGRASGVDASQLGRSPRRLLRPRAGTLRDTADGNRRGPTPGPATDPDADREGSAAVGPRAAAGAVPVHGKQRRSQMAQALVEHLTDGAIEASSAGTNPKPLHPNAVRAMREHGIDIAGRRPKHLSRLTDRRFDYVISLCDRVREVCLDRTLRPDAPQRDRERPGRPADPDRRHFGQPDRTLPTRRHLASPPGGLERQTPPWRGLGRVGDPGLEPGTSSLSAFAEWCGGCDPPPGSTA